MIDWPKKPTQWIENRTLYISIPFTWNIAGIKEILRQKSFFWDRAVLGGPAIALESGGFGDMEHVAIGQWHLPGVLQRVNPLATKTTMGCIRRCKFCAVPKTESPYFKTGFKELEDWPDLPILVDNNLLAASIKHFDRVIDRLKKHTVKLTKKGHTVDFNQGIDARLLTKYHAKRFKELKKPMLRLALDKAEHQNQWSVSFRKLINAGIVKDNIRSYALIGYESGPGEAWKRCQWIESHGIKVLPMWFHDLDAKKQHQVTEDQKKFEWNDLERRRIMQWYYFHNEKYGRSKHRGG